jgi:hypothetical protein
VHIIMNNNFAHIFITMIPVSSINL